MAFTPAQARGFATNHVAVWNTRDVEQILEHYTDDCEITSPLAHKLTGVHTVRGKAALREYFTKALELVPDMRFDLVDTLVGVDSITLYLQSTDERMFADVLFIDDAGKIERMLAHHSGG